MSNKKSTSFSTETWSRGTRGMLGAWATNQPRIINFRLDREGKLSPRPVFYELLDLSSVHTFGTAVVIPTQYRVTSPSVVLDGHLFADGTGTWFYETQSFSNDIVVGNATAVATGLGISFMPSDPTVSEISSTEYMIHSSYVELRGTTGITVTDGWTDLDATFYPGAGNVFLAGTEVHQGRAFYWGDIRNASGVVTANNRIWYSDAYNYTNFTSATQFFDIDGAVAGCSSIGSNLFIWTNEGSWYILQGRGNPANATLNSIGKGRIPGPGRYIAKHDNEGIFLSSEGNCVVRVTEGGVMDDQSFGYLGFTNEGARWVSHGHNTPSASGVNNTVIIPQDGTYLGPDIIHRLDGVWTEEDIGALQSPDTILVGSNGRRGVETLAYYDFAPPGGWIIYQRDVNLAGPSREYLSMTYAESPESELWLPRITDDDSLVRVNKVIMDVQYWRGAEALYAYQNPQISLRVDSPKGPHTFDVRAVGQDINNLSTGSSSAEGEPLRLIGQPSDVGNLPYEHFQDVVIHGVKSFAIERVTVEYEVAGGRNV